MTTHKPSMGEQIDAICGRLDESKAAWVAAGRPSSGPEADAQNAVFADLREWNRKAAQARCPSSLAPPHGAADACEPCGWDELPL